MANKRVASMKPKKQSEEISPEEMHEINTNAIGSIRRNLYVPKNMVEILWDCRNVLADNNIIIPELLDIIEFIDSKLDELEKALKAAKLGDMNDMDKVVKVACKFNKDKHKKLFDIAKMHCANQLLQPIIDEFLRISALKMEKK